MKNTSKEKKYQIIYADPPWRYSFSNTDNRKIENHYPTMKLEDIKNLDVPKEENSVLYLWATAPKLIEALEVMEAWGFEYKTHAIWDKQKIGMGYWFRGVHELLMVGVCGKFSPPQASDRISSIFSEPRTKHSKKPEVVRGWINQWFPDASKIELFARKPEALIQDKSWEDWDVWGNEVESDIEL